MQTSGLLSFGFQVKFYFYFGFSQVELQGRKGQTFLPLSALTTKE